VEEIVETLSFQDLLNSFDVKHIDFLKVDIDGAELETLMGVNLSNIVSGYGGSSLVFGEG
jgi:FkbM family methyltransferase